MHENDGFAPVEPPRLPTPGDAIPGLTPGSNLLLTEARSPADWLRESARAAVFLKPRLAQLPTGPLGVAALVLAGVALAVLLQRLLISGEAMFAPQAVVTGWLPTVLLAWMCWLAARRQGDAASAEPVPGTGQLLTALLLKDLLLALVFGAMTVAVSRGLGEHPRAEVSLWAITLCWMAWSALTGLVLLWRAAPPRWPTRAGLVLGTALAAVSLLYQAEATFWYARLAPPAAVAEDDEPPRLVLDQTTIEAQSAAVVSQFAGLATERPGVVDLYAIAFAPYADEDVFSREAAMVGEVMRQRFDAEGRVLRLQNHADTAATLPWATPLNLERAIHAAAAKMNRDEDVLFLHLSSHGAGDGRLAAALWPIEVDEVTPQQLRAWLDAAGVRHRVISISACYSGAWVAPLAEPGTLVMTAADATHTSYGCGRKSPLTFFGRAMYDEQLRTQTLSFETAHAAARTVIAQREKEAGKSDGYSNPQIAVGAVIRERLALMTSQLDARGRH